MMITMSLSQCSCTTRAAVPQQSPLQRRPVLRNSTSSVGVHKTAGCKHTIHTVHTRQSFQCQAVAAAEQKQELDVTKMAPLGDRLLVKPEEEQKTTSGGLLLSSGATKPIQEALIGEILSVGEDVKIDVKVGNKVLYSKYASSDVKIPDGEVSFVAEKSILGTLSS